MKIACIQFKASENKEKNLQQAFSLAEAAVSKGAKIISFPEHFLYLGKRYSQFAEKIPGETTAAFSDFAKENKVAFVLGSISERVPNKRKVCNTTVIINSRGKILGKYRKNKLFRAKLNGGKEGAIDETKQFIAGSRPAVFHLFGYRIGIGICFDLRFPVFFNYYCNQKVDIIFLPSAFTYKTGSYHWEILLRSRAIEGLCYMVAPNQFGVNTATGVRYYGNSMMIDPWGRQLQRAGSSKAAVLVADVQKSLIKNMRKVISL